MARGLLEKKPVNKGAVPLLDHDRLEFIKNGNHYFEFLNEDLTRLTQLQSPKELNGAALKVIQRSGDFNEMDSTTIYGFLIVEGSTFNNSKVTISSTLELHLAEARLRLRNVTGILCMIQNR